MIKKWKEDIGTYLEAVKKVISKHSYRIPAQNNEDTPQYRFKDSYLDASTLKNSWTYTDKEQITRAILSGEAMRYATLNTEAQAPSSTIMMQENIAIRNSFDVFNPTGSTCIFDAMITGFIDIGIQRAARKKEKKKPELYSMTEKQ